MRGCQTVEYAKVKPTTDELVEFRLLLFPFLLLRLGIYVDDLGLRRGLLLDHTLDDNVTVSSGLSHVRHSDRRWGGLRLLC